MKDIAPLHKINLFMLIAMLCVTPGCIVSPEKNHAAQPKHGSITSQTKLPQDLMYKNKPISDKCMEELVPLLYGEFIEIDLDTFIEPKKQNYTHGYDYENDCDEYEWNYIGTLPNGDHLIHGYLWPEGAMGKFTEIAIVRRIGNTLKAIGCITGGNRHATMIPARPCTLIGNKLTYEQYMTTGSLHSKIMKQYPELTQYAENKNHKKLYWGEADYIGYAIFEVIIHNGKIESKRSISFTKPQKPNSNNDLKKYYDDWIKNTPKSSLTMGDALNAMLDFHSYKNQSDTFSDNQLKEMMGEVFAYAEGY